MTEEELSKFIAGNADAIKQATRNAITERIQYSIKYALPDGTQQAINKFFAEEIAPEVTKYLAELKGPILEAAKASAAAISDELAKKMFEAAVKNMDSYRAEEVFKALLGVKRY
jgi:hypothetical protein